MQRWISHVLKHRKIQSCHVYGAGSYYCCLTTTEITAKLRVLSDLLLVVQRRPKKSTCHTNSDIAPLFVHCNLWSHVEGSSKLEYSIIQNFCSHFHGCHSIFAKYQQFHDPTTNFSCLHLDKIGGKWFNPWIISA